MRIFFSVGEPSGDLHASNLIRHLKSQDKSVECVGYGGPRMREAGCDLHFDLTQLAVMFIVEALKKIRQFRALANDAEEYFKANHVDAVVLIDYPGFNWWIAKRAKKHGIPVYFYGVPQMWAWGPWRIRKIRKWVDHVLCKLPFEVDWFQQRNCHATYVGHPYFDQLHQQKFDESFISQLKEADEKLLTLLPGSRDLEVENHLPMLLDTAAHVMKSVDNVKVAVACYNQKQFARAKEVLSESSIDDAVSLYMDRTPELMKAADACVACSGSVSLELMFHRKPTVIVYKPSRLFMYLQNWMLNIKYITLVNLIGSDDIRRKGKNTYDPDAIGADAVMPEYLTCVDRSREMSRHVVRWFQQPEASAQVIARLDSLARKYSQPGATERAANYILNSQVPLAYEQISESNIYPFQTNLLDKAVESGFDQTTAEENVA